MYATTWGPADASQAANQVHSCAYLTKLRKFLEAVLAYTGASTINVITHSMGVTLGRGIIQGGLHHDMDSSTCNLGSPLTSNILTFIGIAGTVKPRI